MISVILVLAAIGILIWAEEKYLPIDAQFKKIIRIIVVICTVVWLLKIFGVLPLSHDIPVPQLR